MSTIKRIDAELDKFYAITRDYSGLENDATAVLVDNEKSTIEVRLKSQQYGSIYEFPNRGNEGVLYTDTTENKAYRWDELAKKYYCVGSDYNQIKIIDGGKA